MGKTVRVLCLAALLLLFFPRALAESRDVLLNERLPVDGGAERDFLFTPTANNLYVFRSFPGAGVSARLYLEGEAQPVAEGEGFSFETRLIADRTYRLNVKSAADAQIEIMRAARGRSIDMPIELDGAGTSYDKVIARAYDTHWFRFTAPRDGIYVIRSESEINMVGYLLSEDGEKIAMSNTLYNPYSLDFRIQARLTGGRSYFVRVSGSGEATGAYRLTLAVPGEGQLPPESIALDRETAALKIGQSQRLTASVSPEGALNDLVFISSDPAIATVDETGLVTATGSGTARIICLGVGDQEARCLVTVESIPVEKILPEEESLSLPAGSLRELRCEVLPENATQRHLRYESDDPSVAAVTRGGTLTAVSEGETLIRVFSADANGRSAEIRVTVTRALPVYRALLIGEQRYQDGRVRVGSVNTTQGMADLLRSQNMNGNGGYEVTMRMDTRRADAVAALREAFADASATDVSLFYINCHGGFEKGTAYLEFHDGTRLTARALERELSRVKGTVVVLIDCCASGAFLSPAAERNFNGQWEQVFSGGSGAGFARSKYRLLVSAASVQDSYRISYDGGKNEASMATVFSRSLCEAGGWDLIGDRKTGLKADLNRDGKVTLHEAYLYVNRRSRRFLSGSFARQDAQSYPKGSPFVLFERG